MPGDNRIMYCYPYKETQRKARMLDTRATDTQVGGEHYRDMEIQPSEFITRNNLNWCEGNAIKYICRHAIKNGVQDIDKAIHYLQLLKEIEYANEEEAPKDYAEEGCDNPGCWCNETAKGYPSKG